MMRPAPTKRCTLSIFWPATDEIVDETASFLARASRRVGLTGFCRGALSRFLERIRLHNIHAASAYYGAPDDALDDAAKI